MRSEYNYLMGRNALQCGTYILITLNKLLRPSFFTWRNSSQCARVSSFTRFLDHTQQRATFGRTPLDEWSAHRRDLYLTTRNTHKRQTSMPLVGFESTISAGERPQSYALDGMATGNGYVHRWGRYSVWWKKNIPPEGL